MAKYELGFEVGDGPDLLALDFDPEVNFHKFGERVKRNRKYKRPKNNSNLMARSLGVGSPSKSPDSLMALKRMADPAIREVLISASKNTMRQFETDHPVRVLRGRIGASLLTATTANHIYRDFRNESATNGTYFFNESVKQYAESINRLRPEIRAGIGRVALFGPTREGAHVIGVSLVGPGAEALAIESQNLIRLLSSSGYAEANKYTPHISLASSFSSGVAKAYGDALQSEIDVQGHDLSAKFGPAQCLPSSLPGQAVNQAA